MLVVPYMHSFNMCTFLFENNVCQFEADFCRELGSLYQTTLTFRLISIPLMNRFYDNELVLTLRSKFEFSFVPVFVSYRSSGEKLIKYQVNSFCMIMSVILMTTLFYKALILQGEI